MGVDHITTEPPKLNVDIPLDIHGTQIVTRNSVIITLETPNDTVAILRQELKNQRLRAEYLEYQNYLLARIIQKSYLLPSELSLDIWENLRDAVPSLPQIYIYKKSERGYWVAIGDKQDRIAINETSNPKKVNRLSHDNKQVEYIDVIILSNQITDNKEEYIFFMLNKSWHNPEESTRLFQLLQESYPFQGVASELNNMKTAYGFPHNPHIKNKRYKDPFIERYFDQEYEHSADEADITIGEMDGEWIKNRKANKYAYLDIDIGQFKAWNDILGYDNGNLVLKIIAGALRANISENDEVMGYGGDEFGVFIRMTLEDITPHQDESYADFKKRYNAKYQDIVQKITQRITESAKAIDTWLKNSDSNIPEACKQLPGVTKEDLITLKQAYQIAITKGKTLPGFMLCNLTHPDVDPYESWASISKRHIRERLDKKLDDPEAQKGTAYRLLGGFLGLDTAARLDALQKLSLDDLEKLMSELKKVIGIRNEDPEAIENL